ncbi:MAG: sulfotransferase [Alphaproteobacteria bacterium]|nr:sulfotransferase [Alphaproteobacteria bacterium]
MDTTLKEYFFISGLPRSGSTLLSGILKQNPDFYADISSPVKSLVDSTLSIITNSEVNQIIDEQRRIQILQDIFEAYFKSEKQSIIFDTCRGWTASTSLLKTLFPKTKIICCVRDIPWILDSFERITKKNSLYGRNATLTDEEAHQTVTTRCDALMDVKKEGQVVKPYYFLEEGLLLNPDMIFLMEYEGLCRDPEHTMRKIYEFIDKPYFDHDFDNVEYQNEIYDKALNLKDLHTLRRKVTWEERPSILPKSVWDKYAGKEFWRPVQVVPDFSIQSIYKIKTSVDKISRIAA